MNTEKSTSLQPAANTTAPIVGMFWQLGLSLLIAAIVFVSIRGLFPHLISALISPRQIVEIGPSPTFSCKAHKGEMVKAVFTVHNTTNSELTLLGVRTACSCTAVASNLPTVLKPDALENIELNLTVGTPGADGKFRSSANLFFDREGEVQPIELVADVVAPAVQTTK